MDNGVNQESNESVVGGQQPEGRIILVLLECASAISAGVGRSSIDWKDSRNQMLVGSRRWQLLATVNNSVGRSHPCFLALRLRDDERPFEEEKEGTNSPPRAGCGYMVSCNVSRCT